VPSVFNRYRQRYSDLTPGGKAFTMGPPLGDYSQDPYLRTDEWMYDFVGNRDGSNDLFGFKRNNTVGYYSGRGSYYYRAESWVTGDNWYWWDFSSISGQPSDNNAALKVLANTNPSRAVVDFPVFIAEFRDFPRMIKHIGNRIRRGHRGIKRLVKDYTPEMAAEDSLAMQFGWAPLISDLIKILGFMDAVNQRCNEIERLYNGNTALKRNHTVYREIIDKGTRSFYCGPLYSAQAIVTVTYQQQLKKWGSVKWLPTTDPAYSNQEQLLDMAKNLVIGAHGTGFDSLWEALPWSWMLDWFGATGDFLEAHRNTVPCQSDDLCIMENNAIRAISCRFDNDPFGDGHFRLEKDPMAEYKLRTAMFGVPNPDVHLPFLNGKQLSILTPLAIQSYGKRRR
jgi:hypothetical protein